MKREVCLSILFCWAFGCAIAQPHVSLNPEQAAPVAPLEEAISVEEKKAEVLPDAEIPPTPVLFPSFTAAIPSHLRRLQLEELGNGTPIDESTDLSALIAQYTCQQDFNLDESVDEIVLLKNKNGKGGVLACLCSFGDGYQYIELESYSAEQFAAVKLEKTYVRSFLCHYDAATDALVESIPFDQPYVLLVQSGVEVKKPFLYNPRRQIFESFWMACY
jgi:hypothetical protein